MRPRQLSCRCMEGLNDLTRGESTLPKSSHHPPVFVKVEVNRLLHFRRGNDEILPPVTTGSSTGKVARRALEQRDTTVGAIGPPEPFSGFRRILEAGLQPLTIIRMAIVPVSCTTVPISFPALIRMWNASMAQGRSLHSHHLTTGKSRTWAITPTCCPRRGVPVCGAKLMGL